MGLLDYIFRNSGKSELQPTEIKTIGPTEVKTVEVGSAGTEIYAGYLDEDYLTAAKGKDWADKIDMMRRSDANVKMVLSALKSPIKSSNWYFVEKEDTEEARMQKVLLEKALFEDINRSFTKLIGEVLTFVDYGYSLFDITHQVKTDKELGTYNTLKSISYRSQRTIERWNVDQEGNLKTVTQISYGDTGVSTELDARFLLHFAPDQEGDNYEGVSILRPMYGNWLRKNKFLQLMAAGIEKYAISTPTLYTPDNASGSAEFASAKKALECYTSNQANYLIMPKSYELKFNNVTFDSDKIRSTIDKENQEMVNSILASFLLLGQSGAGSLALSNSLSDFFSQTVTYLADHIIEQFERRIFIPLLQMNFGTNKLLVEFRCDGLEEKANKQWADTLQVLMSSGAVTKDSEIEDFVRNKFKLPEKEIEEVSQPTPEATPPEPVKLAEKKKQKIKVNDKYPDLIQKTSEQLRDVSGLYLKEFARKYIKSIINIAKKSNSANRIKAPINATVPSLKSYYDVISAIQFASSLKTSEIVEKQFKTKPKKLAEYNLAATKLVKVDDAISELDNAIALVKKAETPEQYAAAIKAIDKASEKANGILSGYLSFADSQTIKAKSEVYGEIQKNDVIKSIDLQFQSSALASEDEFQWENDMFISSSEKIDGTIQSGADVQASQVVNNQITSSSEQYEKETGDSILSYTFVAVLDKDTTQICSELHEHTFSADDPKLLEFSPPLHWNCRSYLQVNTASTKDNPEIDKQPKLSKKAQSQVQF